MKKAIVILATTVSVWSAPSLDAAININLTGNWLGTLEIGSVQLRLMFKIGTNTTGDFVATLDSVDQGARNIPVDMVTVKSNVLRLNVRAVKGVYEGTLNATGTKATGLWTQGPQTLPLTLVKGQGNDSALAAEKLAPADLEASKQAALKVAGTWRGTLVAGSASLRLRLNLSKSATGAASGTLDSLDQGANGIPLSAITLKDGEVRFAARGIGGIFTGTLASDGSTLSGQWQQGGQTLPLEFKKETAK